MIEGSENGPSSSVLIAWTNTLVRALESNGVAPAPLLEAAGLAGADFDDPESRLPLRASTRLWEAAISATNDDAFGIEVSRFVTAGTFHAMGSAFLTSGTLRHALERVARYSRVTADVARGEIEETGEAFTLLIGWGEGHERPAAAAVDAVLAAIVRSTRSLLGRDLNPVAVVLERAPPEQRIRFEAFFGCPVTYSAGANRMTFHRSDVDRPIPGGNERLATISDTVVAEYLAGLQADTLLDEIRAVLADALLAGEPALAAIANEFAMSPRTLQRRIGEQGTTFRGVVAETRLDLATAMLANGVSVTETSRRVGFSETAAFSRAFRRWTGGAPSDTRRSNGQHHRRSAEQAQPAATNS